MEKFEIEQRLPRECMECSEDETEHTIRNRWRKMSFGLISKEPRYLNDPRTDPSYRGPYRECYYPDYGKESFSSMVEEIREAMAKYSRKSTEKCNRELTETLNGESIEKVSQKPGPDLRAESIPLF